MEAFMFSMDTIANNLANAGTHGFKRSRVNFEDLYYQHIKTPGTEGAAGQTTPLGISVGLGSRVASTARDHSQGSPVETGRNLDVAIMGDGFLQVTDGTSTFYTRFGALTQNSEGQLTIQSANEGWYLVPNITVPPDVTDVTISDGGRVMALPAGQTVAQEQGIIQLARFVNPQGLLQVGENLYAETQASGTATLANAGADGAGELKAGFLEASNVEPVEELVDLIKTQRNIELNSQVVQAADQILQLIANLRRF